MIVQFVIREREIERLEKRTVHRKDEGTYAYPSIILLVKIRCILDYAMIGQLLERLFPCER